MKPRINFGNHYGPGNAISTTCIGNYQLNRIISWRHIIAYLNRVLVCGCGWSCSTKGPLPCIGTSAKICKIKAVSNADHCIGSGKPSCRSRAGSNIYKAWGREGIYATRIRDNKLDIIRSRLVVTDPSWGLESGGIRCSPCEIPIPGSGVVGRLVRKVYAGCFANIGIRGCKWCCWDTWIYHDVISKKNGICTIGVGCDEGYSIRSEGRIAYIDRIFEGRERRSCSWKGPFPCWWIIGGEIRKWNTIVNAQYGVTGG